MVGITGAIRHCSAPRKLDHLKLKFSATFSRLGEERNRIKASKFTDAQKAFIIKQGEEGAPVAEICRKAGMRTSVRKSSTVAAG